MDERLYLRLEGDPLHPAGTSVPEGTMRAHSVRAALRRHVMHIATYRETIAPGTEVVERILPDGACRLILNLGQPPIANGSAALRLELVGASATPTLLQLSGRLAGVSVTLRPGAVRAVLGRPARAFRGVAVPLDDLWRAEGERLHEILEAPTEDGRVSALQDLLERRVIASEERPSTRHALRAIERIRRTSGKASLRGLAANIGITERRLQQAFADEVGLTPKAMARLLRVHACLRRIRQGPPKSIAALAATFGYADQSHLVREMRALCGLTPSDLVRRTISHSSKTTR